MMTMIKLPCSLMTTDIYHEPLTLVSSVQGVVSVFLKSLESWNILAV